MTKKKKLSLELRILGTIFLKDVKSQIHEINDLISIILFNIISIFLFSSAITIYTKSNNMPLEIFVIEIWIIIFFSLIFIMAKLFVKEKESGTLDGILSSPISSYILIISKIMFSFVILIIIEIVLFSFSFIFSAPIIEPLTILELILYLLIGIVLPTIDLCVCGTMVSAFSMYVKKKSFVLTTLFFPILLPITVPIISLNIKLIEGQMILNGLYEIIFLLAHLVLMSSILALIADDLLYE